MTLANKTIGNAIAGALGYVWPIALALATTPYIVHKLGNDAYGILALVTSVLGFFAFLDLGVTNAAVKYIAEAYARNDLKEIGKIIGSSLSVFLLVGAVGAVLIAAMTSVLVQKLLRIPAEYASESAFAFYVAACGFVLNMAAGVFAAVPKAIQRYDLATKANMLIGTLLTLSTVLIIALGYGLRQVVILNFLSGVLSLCIYIAITKRHLKGVSLAVRFDGATFKKLFRFGVYSLVVILAATTCYQLDRVLIGSFLGSAAVAFYVVPASVAAAIRNIDTSLMGVVFPLCSHLSATNEIDKMRYLYLRASKYAFIVVLSLATPVIVLSGKIMTIWMGPEYAASSPVLAVLALTTVFNSVATVPFLILDGTGLPHVNARFSVLSGILNIVLCFLLIPSFGLIGAAFANLSNVIIVFAYLVTVDRNIMHIGLKHIAVDVWLRPFLTCLLQGAVTYYAFMPYVSGKASLLLALASSLGIYYGAAFVFNIVDTEDRDLFRQYVSLKVKEGIS